jgi:hypothetical protein
VALIIADRVRDTTSTTGTGNITVSGTAPITYRTFSAVCSVSDTFPYFIAARTVNEWEVGLATYTSSNTIARTQIFSSSNAGSLVSFSAGTKDVVLSQTAEKTGTGNYTVTSSMPFVDWVQTWNNGAELFTGIKSNITDTASATGSNLIDLQLGSVSKFKVDKAGNVVSGNVPVSTNSPTDFLCADKSWKSVGVLSGALILRAAIPSTTITKDTFITSGFLTDGDYGTGAFYTSVGATSGGPMAIQDASATWFNLVLNGTANTGWFGAKADGSTDDSLTLQSAFNTIHASGGIVAFNGGQTSVISSTITIQENVSVNGNGATLLTSTSAFLDSFTNDFSGQAVVTCNITVNPTVGSNSITVDSVAGLAIGNRVAIQAGDDITDPSSPNVSFTAVIINIVGLVLTIDRIFTYAVTPVGSSHHTVQLFPQYQHDFYVRDLCLENNGSASVDHGMANWFAYNIEYDNIIGNRRGGLNMGYGLIAAFWCEDITIRHCALYHNRNTEAFPSHGRMFNFAGCRNVYVYDAECQDTHDNFAYVESHSQNINFFDCSIRHYNNSTSFNVFSCDLSQIYAENTYVELPNSYNFVSFAGGGDPFTRAQFRNITLRGSFPNTMPFYPDVMGKIDFNDGTNYFVVDLDSAYTGQTTVPLNSGGGTFYFDYGLILSIQVYTSLDVNTGDIADVLFGTVGTDGSNNNNGEQFVSNLVANNWVTLSLNSGAGIFGTGGNTYGNFTRLTNRPKVLVNLVPSATRGYLSFRYRVAPFVQHNNAATPISPQVEAQSTFFANAMSPANIQSGQHIVTAGEAAATTVTFRTGLNNITTINIQITRSNVIVTSTAVASDSAGQLTVSNGAGYTLTNGDVINWIVIA